MKIFNRCIYLAKGQGVDLMPESCLKILEENYKGRLDVMSPKTIFQKVYDLMGVLGEPDKKECWRATNEFLNAGTCFAQITH